jgi:hemolysin activation/secretion protein
MLGYHESVFAGAYRNIARTEARWSGASLVRGADVGFAAFGQVGSVWAGDAPYGRTATRGSVGIGVLAAYPTGSKRTYRVDVGIPLVRSGEGGGKIEVRFSSEDRTQLFWREPRDVSRARTGTVPTDLFAFPTR